MENDLGGARVFFWTADAKKKYGTVVEGSTRCIRVEVLIAFHLILSCH